MALRALFSKRYRTRWTVPLVLAASGVLTAGCAETDPLKLYNEGLQSSDLEQRVKLMTAALDAKPEFSQARFQRARAYIGLARHEEALRDLRTLLQEHEGGGKETMHYWIGFAYERAGQLDEAISQYSTALRISPWFVNVYEARAGAYFKAGRYAEAARDLSERIDRDRRPSVSGQRDRGAWQYRRAFAYACTGQWKSAARDFEAAIGTVGDSATKARAVLNLYFVACRIGSKKKADLVLRQYAEEMMKDADQNPPWALAAVWFAADLMTREQFLAASRDQNPERQGRRLSQAQYYIGARALANEDRNAAGTAFRKATERAFPDSYEYHLARVELKRLASGGGTADGLLARALEEDGHVRRLKLLERALELEPGHVGALYHRAVLYSLLGEHDRAIADFTRLLRRIKEPARVAEILRYRALAHSQKGDHAAAAADFQGALQQAPDSWEARNGLAWSLGMLRRYEEAAKQYGLIAKQVTGRGQKAPWLMSKGLALSCSGNWVEATNALRAAVKEGGSGALLQSNLYIAERRTGNSAARRRLKTFCDSYSVADWAGSVAWHLDGRKTAKQLIESSQHSRPQTQQERTSRAYYYIGAALRLNGAPRTEVLAACAECVRLGRKLNRETWELRLALAEMEREKKKP
jgi:tetratricopeptide (TPR) repeat protein